MKGVNLGGWLVLERWITPSLFTGTDAKDEFSFCLHYGERASRVLENHRESFIRGSDFKWLAVQGIDSVRLPIGYWALGEVETYIGCEKYIDFAFEQCQKYGLRLIIDIHGLPGSQNGYYHSGKGGQAGWGDKQTVEESLAFLDRLIKQYKDQDGLAGIELANEPLSRLRRRNLADYYKEGYEMIRQALPDSVSVIISDAFDARRWAGSMPQDRYKNVLLDMHLYQVFTLRDKRLSLAGHIKEAERWKDKIRKAQQYMPVIIGEWSVALAPNTDGINELDDALRQYGDAQLEAFSESAGWFYWTYKTETMRGWDFRRLVEDGVLDIKK